MTLTQRKVLYPIEGQLRIWNYKWYVDPLGATPGISKAVLPCWFLASFQHGSICQVEAWIPARHPNPA